MYDTQIIANRIKKTAKLRNAKIKDMLNQLDLGVNLISQFAKGQVMSSINLAKIADYLNCSVDYLLCRTDIIELNAELPKQQKVIPIDNKTKSTIKTIIKPLYLTPASAGIGSWLDDDTPTEWITVPKSDKTASADFLIRVRGDSMQPKYYDGDIVLVKQSSSITEGEYGVFILNNEAFIKKMGKGELISLNPDYDNIAVSEYDTISCAGKVIGILKNE